MIIRAAKCLYGPITQRENNGDMESVTQKVTETIDGEEKQVKRGVLAGLDKSHNRDYKVPHVGDPILAVHGDLTTSHEKLKERLEDFDLWCQTFHPIHIPRTDADGSNAWMCAYKTTPEEANRLPRFKEILDEESEGLSLESDTDIEVQVPNKQRVITEY
jgi:hypothetical protein